MIDLHTHSIFSDGELIPSELARRAEESGYKALGITDHADHSNLDLVIPRIAGVSEVISSKFSVTVIPGTEITHVHPGSIEELVARARSLGAKIVIVHGETIVEPVREGTNRAALLAGIDILAHPGLIAEDDVRLASERGVFLEITTRKGHSLTNGHVASLARKYGANLVMNTDSHSPGDLVDDDQARRIARGAGMTDAEIDVMFMNSKNFVQKIIND